MIYASDMKEFFVRVKVRGMYYYGQGRTPVEAINAYNEKYKNRPSPEGGIEIEIFQRFFIDGELTEKRMEG